MKWFTKYWLLKHKYDELLLKYNELVRLVDEDFWGVIERE